MAETDPSTGAARSVLGEDVIALIELFHHSDLTDLSVERAGRKLVLRKGAAQVEPNVDAQEQVEEENAPAAGVPVKAHLVGVFYAARDKRGTPVVTLHQQVTKGHVLGFIEAMDIMNEVEAPLSGEVIEIAVRSGQPVEYGQALLTMIPEEP